MDSRNLVFDRFHLPLALGVSVIVAVFGRGSSFVRGQDSPASKPLAASAEGDEAEIARLVRQLGAEAFEARELAQAKLQRFGARAFDALLEAQRDSDLEISERATFLVRALQVAWAADDDPLPVRLLLRNYSAEPSEKRAAVMDQLRWLPRRQGLSALCRLARFETDPFRAKKAAILVLRMGLETDPNQRSAFAEQVQSIVGQSRRDTSTWLRTLARTLNEPETTLVEWDRLCGVEHTQYMRLPDDARLEIARDLLRWQTELLLSLGREKEATVVIEKLHALVELEARDVQDAIDWLIEHKQWARVVELGERFEGVASEQPVVMYRIAEAHRRLGEGDKAEALATQAREMRPDDDNAHRVAATELQRVGLFDWAEKEYRSTIKRTRSGLEAWRCWKFLAEMLHDQAREAEAAAAMENVILLQDEDREVAQRVRDEIKTDGVGRMNYFFACAARQRQDRAEEKERLRQAIEANEDEIDSLIALWRLPDKTPEESEDVRTRIENCTKQYAERIQAEASQLADAERQDENKENIDFHRMSLAMQHNQSAWLVANTFGDYRQALASSLESLRLRENEAAYLDTLGRCHYALGDLESAIDAQKAALRQEPHSGQMNRQLAMFEKALKERLDREAADAPPANEAAP